MSEWEPAPRLTAALERRAESMPVGRDGWDELAERIDSAGASTSVTVRSTSPGGPVVPSRPRMPRGNGTWLVATAAAILVGALLLPSMLRDVETIETAAPLGDDCVEFSAEPTLHTSATGLPILVSSQARVRDEVFRTHDPVVIDATGLLSSAPEFSTLVSAEGLVAEQVPELVEELGTARCAFLAGAALYLVAPGPLVANDGSCSAGPGSPGFWGVIVVAPERPPARCGPVQTTLLGVASEATEAAWVLHHEASDSLDLRTDREVTEAEVLSALDRLWNR